MEGLVRRELQAVGARILDVAHGDAVTFAFAVTELDAATLVTRLNEAGQGLLRWGDASAGAEPPALKE